METKVLPGNGYEGNDRVLIGIILGLLTFWLFAMTLLNVSGMIVDDLRIGNSTMGLAVSIASLFSGLFVVFAGSLADRFGRVLILRVGFVLAFVGALLVAVSVPGIASAPMLIVGRVLQGLACACIMPSSLALIKEYWAAERQNRAVSLWSMGSWGGTSFSALVGGLIAGSLGWRWIFVASALCAVIGYLLVRQVPESRAPQEQVKRFDMLGFASFFLVLLSLLLLLLKGSEWGLSVLSYVWLGVLLVSLAVFMIVELQVDNPFIDFKLFKNLTFTGATVSNLLLNATAGVLIVSLVLIQEGANLTAQQTGYLTIGYGVTIVLFIRVGEKLLNRYGARKPMVWGCLIVLAAIGLLIPTHTMATTYVYMAIAAFCLYGVGLAFYATPSTSAALSNLPSAQSGVGSGIYKTASSVGSAFGLAVSSALFYSLKGVGPTWSGVSDIISFQGRQDNVGVRSAAMVTLLMIFGLVLLALISILITVKNKKKAAA